MTRSLPATLCSLALILAACSSGNTTGPDSTSAGGSLALSTPVVSQVPSRPVPSAPAATKPRPADTATPTPSETPHGHVIGSSASYPTYESLASFRSCGFALAIVEIVAVSEPRWDTPTGARPPEALLHAPPLDPEFPDHYNIGRLISVRRVRVLQGTWPVPEDTVDYWRPGGTVGLDWGEEVSLYPPVTASDVGRRGIAFMLPTLLLGIPPTIASEVCILFPADAQGRIVTPLETEEGITLDSVESFLPRP